ncbi:Protein kinase and PP2C-like domain-containing protein [Triticum urartu]|uniref:protein-serine/threonine phosphatase n=1 Tax=Triticum urartu TaxID=4572 RepID=M7ZXG4_TRIUA|nr:Protein kinase and PP2C-like domain-containing protein [Triticum urartu]
MGKFGDELPGFMGFGGSAISIQVINQLMVSSWFVLAIMYGVLPNERTLALNLSHQPWRQPAGQRLRHQLGEDVDEADEAVTRSIGDDDLKPAVTALPEITETDLTADDEFLVMASDGLWDVVGNEDVLSIIKGTVKEPGMCSKRLATEASARGSKDNITVIVVFLRPVSTAERIY